MRETQSTLTDRFSSNHRLFSSLMISTSLTLLTQGNALPANKVNETNDMFHLYEHVPLLIMFCRTYWTVPFDSHLDLLTQIAFTLVTILSLTRISLKITSN
jgi:hypothetical protein